MPQLRFFDQNILAIPHMIGAQRLERSTVFYILNIVIGGIGPFQAVQRQLTHSGQGILAFQLPPTDIVKQPDLQRTAVLCDRPVEHRGSLV